MEESSCDRHLRTKNKYPDEEVHTIVLKLLRADPDANGSHCQWIIDSFLLEQFKIDEDEEIVKEDILKFKKLFGERRALPNKGYSEMKVMIREKLDKESKKSISQSRSKTSKTVITDCKSFYKNVKNTLPEPYKNYSKEQSDALFEMIENANPTGDFKVCIWIVDEIKAGYINREDLNDVKKYLGRYLKHDLPLPNFYPNFSTYSNYQLVKDAVDKKVDLLFTGDLGILLIPLSMETSCYYGAQTSWCTAQRNQNNKFDKYSKTGNIYIWFDMKIKDKFQFQFEESEFKDRDNNDISKQRLNEFMKHPVLNVIFNEGIPRTMKNPRGGYYYAKNFIGGRWIEAEKYIMKDPLVARFYAKDVIRGRWMEAEPNILKDPKNSYFYAKDVIGDRWPNEITKDGENLRELAEHSIMEVPMAAFGYARDVIGGRWIEAEPYILKEPLSASHYAEEVIRDRWPNEITKDGGNLREKAENIIMTDPEVSFRYASEVIRDRWPNEITKDGENLREKAENIIIKNTEVAKNYTNVMENMWRYRMFDFY